MKLALPKLAKRLRRRETQAATLASPSEALIEALLGGVRSSAGVSVTPGTVLGLAVAYACVNVISKCFATLPIRLYEGTSDGKRRIAREHPLHILLASVPNGEMTTVDFRRTMQAHLSLHNNAYAEILRVGNRPVALWPIHPANIKTSRDTDNRLMYEFCGQLDGKAPLRARDVLHLRGLTLDGICGMDPVSGPRDVFGLARAGDQRSEVLRE